MGGGVLLLPSTQGQDTMANAHQRDSKGIQLSPVTCQHTPRMER